MWRDIKTDPPPKDGTPILALWNGPPAYAVIMFNDAVWWEGGEAVCDPTHWMPLPPPPDTHPQKGE